MHLVAFGVSFVIFFASDYLFPYEVFHFILGIVRGAIDEAFNSFGLVVQSRLLIVIWSVTVVVLAFTYCRLQNRIIKILLLALIAVLLCVVDFIFINVIYFDIMHREISVISIAVRALGKALILATIVYLNMRQQRREALLSNDSLDTIR